MSFVFFSLEFFFSFYFFYPFIFIYKCFICNTFMFYILWNIVCLKNQRGNLNLLWQGTVSSGCNVSWCNLKKKKKKDKSIVNDIYKNTFLVWQIYLKTFLENNMLTCSSFMVNMLIPLTWLHHMTFIQSLNWNFKNKKRRYIFFKLHKTSTNWNITFTSTWHMCFNKIIF